MEPKLSHGVVVCLSIDNLRESPAVTSVNTKTQLCVFEEFGIASPDVD